jgi:hypothetical protein
MYDSDANVVGIGCFPGSRAGELQALERPASSTPVSKAHAQADSFSSSTARASMTVRVTIWAG